MNWLKFKYSWAPFLGSMVWLGTLVALFVLWLVDGPPYYKQNRTIIYISYAGAKWKGLFVPGTIVTGLFYIVTLILDVELRRHERIPAFLQRRESAFAVLSIIFGSMAAVCLALLAIFDVRNHNTAHWIFTVFFIVGVFLNGIFNLFEIKYLARSHFQLGYLRRNAFAKLILGSVGLAFAIAFGVLNATCNDNSHDPFDDSCDAVESTAAVFEWLIALIFVFFLLTYVIDFRAVEDPPASLIRIQQQQQQEEIQNNNNGNNVVGREMMPKPHEENANPHIGSAVA